MPARALQAGDVLRLADGRQAQVVGGGWLETAARAALSTYNLEVADWHTYFVGQAGVWVHNLCSAAVEAWASKFEATLAKYSGDFEKSGDEVMALMREDKGFSDADYDAVGEYIGLRKTNQGQKLTKPIPWRQQEYTVPDPRLVEEAKSFRADNKLLTPLQMNRNISVAKVTVDGQIRFLRQANTPNSFHSEQLVANEILGLRADGHTVIVEQLFTEREPCSNASCRKLIETVMGKPKVYYWTRKGLNPSNAIAVAKQYGLH